MIGLPNRGQRLFAGRTAERFLRRGIWDEQERFTTESCSVCFSDLAIESGTATRWCSRTAKGSVGTMPRSWPSKIHRRSWVPLGREAKEIARATPGNVVAYSRSEKYGVIAISKVT